MKPTMTATAVALLLVLTAPSVCAGQNPHDWEFALFGGSASFDKTDPYALSFSRVGDPDGDGTLGVAFFDRAVDMKTSSTFAGFRLGYNWNQWVSTEISYDDNRVSARYRHTVDNVEVADCNGDGTPENCLTRVESVSGNIPATFTSYQVGLLYHPLGKWKTRFQPYATITAGIMDIDFTPAKTLQGVLDQSKATNALNVPFHKHDQKAMIGYGIGLKFYLIDSLAFRADVRGKTYDYLDQRRNDMEFTLGVSVLVPGSD